MKQEILKDVQQNGKKRPWRPKKVRGLKLADSYKRLGFDNKSMRVWTCGNRLEFRVLEDGQRKLQNAYFCKERLCPMCQWRKSIKIFHQVSRVMDVTEGRHDNLIPVFLTLTLRNCVDQELASTLDNLFKGWYRFTNHRKINRIVQGWFRALEVTYNKKENTYHPHVHVVLMVDRTYFTGKDYMHIIEWVKMWRMSLKLDYDPICDIRKVKADKGKHKAVAEIAKYTMKDTDYILADKEKMDKIVMTLSQALRNRRLYAFGGLLKIIAKELKADSLDEGDLVHIDAQSMREDVAMLLEQYRWNFGIADYIRER